MADTDLAHVFRRYTARRYPSLRAVDHRERFLLCWDEAKSEFEECEAGSLYPVDTSRGSLTVDPTQRRQIDGIWAPTRYRGDILTYDFYHSGLDHDAINRGFATVYRSRSIDFNSAVYRALLSGQSQYSGVIYSGYLHNLAALVLVGMVFRGIIRAKVWLRALIRTARNQCATCGYSLNDLPSKICPECGRDNADRLRGFVARKLATNNLLHSLLQRRSERRYSLLVRFGHPLRTLLVVAAIFLIHASVIGSGSDNLSGSSRIIGSYFRDSNQPHYPGKPLQFDFIRGRMRDHMVPTGHDPDPNERFSCISAGSPVRNSKALKIAEVSIVEYGVKTLRGLWAPTREHASYPIEINGLQPMTVAERDKIRPLLVKALHRYYVVPRSGVWLQSVERGESSRNQRLVAGYAHNVFALFLVMVMLRIIIGYRAILTAREERRQRATTTCPCCGNELPGLMQGLCPECGGVAPDWERRV